MARNCSIILEEINESLKDLKEQDITSICTSDISEAALTSNAYTFDPTVDAIEVLNKGTTDLTITIQTKAFTIEPDEKRILSLPAKIGLVSFSAGAVFRMNGLNRG